MLSSKLLEFRDAVLHGRYQLEACLDNDQTNAVLGLFDDILGEYIMNWTKVAQEAYDAYGRRTDFKNFQGNPMPKWEELPSTIQEAWIVASRQAFVSVSRIITEKLDPI